MEYVRLPLSALTSKNPIECKKVTLIWAVDGWCYIPELKIRRKFTETHFFRENWDGVIAMPQYIEEVTWTVHSTEPLIWQEKGPTYNELYSTKKKQKPTKSSHRPHKQVQKIHS